MSTIDFMNAVKSVIEAGLQIDIVPALPAGNVIVMVVPQPDENGNYDRVFQDTFPIMAIDKQSDFINHAVKMLTARTIIIEGQTFEITEETAVYVSVDEDGEVWTYATKPKIWDRCNFWQGYGGTQIGQLTTKEKYSNWKEMIYVIE